MKDLITEARELCAVATPGQWKRHDTADYAEIHNGDTWGKDLSPIALVGHTDDANFIARSRTLIPELCNALEKAQFDAEWNKRLYETACADRDFIEAERRWIPVTERLPDNTKDDWVLAQITETNGYKWIPEVMEYRERTGDWYCDKIGWLKDHKDSFMVTHWMPLPAPPEKEGAEHERD